ncbi:MAG: TraR/DksA C4-type zinc finger protein [Gammaproteobacteria bacterium]|nr:TraR/DksA C4-type zinc finger protein [Gammaproteobacteria bacterium]MCW8972952.1 TraR/DksA C4-type zinc finger protein [Gammaproteobacteria bacterium]MCW8993708.1 TraR/DksA C4-type zinc finger protein [Gammaproteobacteria bacterium]
MSHLSDEQLAELKQTLEVQRMQLRQDIRDELLRSDDEQYGELAGQVHDTGDESVADLLSDINSAVIGQSIKALREVEAAQERIREGYYGRCEDCEVDIPYERLRAYPSARRCLADQERYEKLHGEETSSI